MPPTKSLSQRNCSIIRHVLIALCALSVTACSRDAEPQQRDADNRKLDADSNTFGSRSTADDSIQAPSRDPTGRDSGWTVGLSASNKPPPRVAILTAVRTARHDGFERIVFEFQADQLPNYRVEYVDRPVRACGSGEPVALKGDAWLQISLEPAYAHDDDGHPTVKVRALMPMLPNLLELKLICDFEAIVSWAAGLKSPNRYRVLELSAPARIVVDIR
ncbi:MAG: hypothetical protein WEE89_00900 [Gemmatimonadota bacterium]